MKITDVEVKDLNMGFVLRDATAAQANGLRRAIISLVPTLAIETVEFHQNSSAVYDEVVAHRLGLLPLTTDLGAYKLRSEFPDDDVHRAECEVKLSLEAKGPCTVYAEEMKSKDPSVKCAFPKMPIVKLLKDQELKFEATAVLGQGTEHMKWSAGAAFYQELPVVIDGKKEIEVLPKDVLGKKSQEVFIKNDGSLNLDIDAKNPEISSKQDAFLFTVESWGQLDPQTIVKEAVNQLNQKLEEVQHAAEAMK